MGNLSPIVLLLVAIGALAVWRSHSAKFILLLSGALILSGCLSLRLGGKNEEPKQANRVEVAYIDRDGTVAQR
jgi:predicted membrane metal-binding protein